MRSSRLLCAKGPASISMFNMFSVGIGPSSSHTVGPMRAARHWARSLEQRGVLEKTLDVRVSLYGSLAATGEGHATPMALALGLMGHEPKYVDPSVERETVARMWDSNRLMLNGLRVINFGRKHISWQPKETLPLHSNGMSFSAVAASGEVLVKDEFYSIGGGFFVDQEGLETDDALAKVGGGTEEPPEPIVVRFPFQNATELFAICKREKMSISELMLANETAWTRAEDIVPQMLHIWHVMNESIERGLNTPGILPGGLS